MKLSPSEKLIQRIFQSRFGIALTKIDELHGKKGRTSDFEHVREGQRVFVCELKDFEDVPLLKKPGRTIIHHPDGFVETFGKDNSLDRVGRHIRKAHKQLSKYSEPKVLIFLNYTRSLDVTDLEEAFRGFRIMAVENDTQYVNVYARRVAEGDIKEIKKEIDLYIWVDTTSDSTSMTEAKVYFRTVTEAGRKLARECFGKPSTVA